MILFEIYQRFKGHFLNKLCVSFNVKKKGGLRKVSVAVFEFFLIVEKEFRCTASNQKRKFDVQQMVSSLMMDFSIRSPFTTLRNSASEE